jgi:phage-related protein
MSSVFTWIPSDAARTVSPAVYSARFGDGYEQNTPRGLNYLPQSWDLQFKCPSSTVADAILAFLNTQGGTAKFQWTPPRASAPILVLCRKWSDTTKPGGITTVSATFEQTFGV